MNAKACKGIGLFLVLFSIRLPIMANSIITNVYFMASTVGKTMAEPIVTPISKKGRIVFSTYAAAKNATAMGFMDRNCARDTISPIRVIAMPLLVISFIHYTSFSLIWLSIRNYRSNCMKCLSN